MKIKNQFKLSGIIIFSLFFNTAFCQNAVYENPIIHQDFSDPDVIRVGDTYVMTSSSFNHVPGLPLLTSTDLVNWKLNGYALNRLVPEDYYSNVRHGCGVWAPSIRFHQNEFYIYYPDPDFGIYLIKSKSINGPWSKPILVLAGKGLIDPCPLWDDNGKAYIVHAYAGSRAGIKSILAVKEMSADGSKIISDGKVVYDGHQDDPTVEGPKFYKYNGYYYIFAPAGGVGTGWQIVLRSKSVYGPYERKVAMSQGQSKVNGPHQGAWIQTQNGEDWFIHFQDKEVYGRIAHLQPMRWGNNWPVIGVDKDSDGIGEPVIKYSMPSSKIKSLESSFNQQVAIDDFNEGKLNVNWQWQANSHDAWYFLKPHQLRLYARYFSDSLKNLYDVPNLLLQKFPAEQFEATTKLTFNPLVENEKCGLIVFGYDYSFIGLQKMGKMIFIVNNTCKKAAASNPIEVKVYDTVKNNQPVYLRVKMLDDHTCKFSYSFEDKNYTELQDVFIPKQGKWVGAKIGIFANGEIKNNDCGSADFEWFKIKK